MKMAVLALACLALAAGGVSSASAKAAYSVWTTSSLEKVLKHAAVKPLKPAVISAARGEHEAFQIVLRAGRGGLRSVAVDVSPLQSGSNTIPASAISLYLEHYVYLPTLSEYYPDALPPYAKPFDLAAGQTQPVWVDVNVPRDAKLGVYSGTIGISADGGAPTVVPFSLRVYSFEMPEPRMTTAFGMWSGEGLLKSNGREANAAQAAAMYRAYYDCLLDHGISAYGVPGDIMSDEWAKYATNPRVTSFKLEFSKDESAIRRQLDRVRSLGVWDKAYFYFVDEPKTEAHYKALKEGCEFLRKIDPKVNIVSPYWCDPDFSKESVNDLLRGQINIWCFVTAYYHENDLAARRAAGEKIWDYVCCGPGKPHANFFVDFTPLEHRMLFWQNYQYEVSGLLYWEATCWNPASTKDVWEDAATVKSIREDIYGDGLLLYPGSKVGLDGPVSSVRLEIIRDGIEDYSYLWMLEQKAGREAVMPYVKKLSTDWTNYCSDPELFKTVREEIAERIETTRR